MRCCVWRPGLAVQQATRRSFTRVCELTKFNVVAFATDVIRRTSYFLLAQIASRIINFLYMLFLAARLSTELFGALSIALTILIVADTVADLGLSRLAVRTLSRDSSLVSSYVGRLISLKLILSLMTYGVCVAGVLAGGQGPDVTIFILIIGTGLMLTGAAAILESVLQSQNMFGFIGGAHVGLSLVQAAMGVWVITSGGGTAALAVTFLVSNLTFLILVLASVMWKQGIGSMRLAPPFWLSQISQSLPYAATAMASILSMRCELLILSWVSTPEQVAYFSVAARFNEAAILTPIVLSTVLMPIYSRYHHDLPGKLAQSYAPVLQWGLVCAVPAALSVALLVEPVIAMILPKYLSSAGLAALMIMSMPLYAICQLNNAVLLSSDRQGRTMLLLAGLAILQFVIGLAYIIPYSAQGAALSYATWTLAAAVISTLLTRFWYLPELSLFCAVKPALLGAVTMGVALWLMWHSHLAIKLAVAIAVYGPTVWFMMRVQRERCRAAGIA